MKTSRKRKTGATPRQQITHACLARVRVNQGKWWIIDAERTAAGRERVLNEARLVPPWLAKLVSGHELRMTYGRRDTFWVWLRFTLALAQIRRAQRAGVKLEAAR